MFRIAIGGFQHETNTFAPSQTHFADFEVADGWPALSRGEALFGNLAGNNIPIAGFIDAARSSKECELTPLLWCSASPGGKVTSDAFERIMAMLLDDLQAAGSVDAVYLDLHGAMVTEEYPDGEAEILRRVRQAIGANVALVASLDLHGNLSAAMVEHSDALLAYRSYPHLDMAETGARTARHVLAMLRTGRRDAKSFRKLPFLVPLTSQCTLTEPAKSLYASLDGYEKDISSISLLMGFPPADVADCGPAIVAYGDAANRAADRLYADMLAKEEAFCSRLWTPDEAVRHAMEHYAGKPIVIADTQDNPGAGGNSDTTGMLEALLRQGAKDAVFGCVYDPAAAEAAHRAGIGKRITVALGSGFKGEFTVIALGDGNFTATGPMYGGSRMQLGKMAALAIDGVTVVVASKKQQAGDQSMLRHVGIEPVEQKILVLKSSVHFRADFDRIAGETLIALAPGPNLENPEQLPYRNLRDGVRLRPCGKLF